MPQAKKKKRALSVQQLKQLGALLKDLGETDAAKKLGVARTTLARAAAGFDLQPGTLALFDRELAKGEVMS